jgi:hypothetical protein
MRFLFFRAFVLFFCLPLTVFSKEATIELREISDLSAVLHKAKEFSAKYGPENVLVIYDYDNVLSKTQTYLGSEPWFNWRGSFLSDPNRPLSLFENHDELLLLCLRILEIKNVVPTQENVAAVVNEIQNLGAPSLVLTSRDPMMYALTQADLARVGVSFAKSAIGKSVEHGNTYLPYDLNTLEASGLTLQDMKAFELPSVPKVTLYKNGLFMTRGQNKGAMLITLLKMTGFRPKAVLFTDDSSKHVNSVAMALQGMSDIEATLYRYTRHEDWVRGFDNLAAKETTESELKALEPLLRKAMADRSPLRLLAPGQTPDIPVCDKELLRGNQ